jgi:hypothetical protein
MGLDKILLAIALLVLFAFATGNAAEEAQPLPDGPGKDLLMSKCFQCHSEGMWKDQRQDRRGWQGALYRMVGRGALWSEDEINTMANYLSTALPPREAKAAK